MPLLKRGEQPVDYAAAEPAAKPGVDRKPVAEPFRQGTPFAAILQDLRKRVYGDDLRNPHVPALSRQAGVDLDATFCRDLFHHCAPLDCRLIVDRHLSMDPSNH